MRGNGDLPELPTGWVWSTLGEVGQVSGGITKNRKRAELPRSLPYVRVANVYAGELKLDDIKEIGIRDSEVSAALLERGDLLVVEGNGSADQIGRVALWDGSIRPCLHQNHIIKVRFRPAELGGFALYWLLSPAGRAQIGQVASSTSGLYTLSISKVGALPVPWAPLAEQRRIVAKVEELLSQLDAGVEALHKVKAQLSRYRQGVLKAAFEGKLTEKWRGKHTDHTEPASALVEGICAERRQAWWDAVRRTRRSRRASYREPVSLDVAELPDLPDGWAWSSYDALTTLITSGSRAWKARLGRGNGIFILVQNVRSRRLDLSSPVRVDAPAGPEADRSRVQKGDVLICIVGETGACALVGDIGEAYVSQSVALTRPSPLLDGRYLEFYLSSEEWGYRFLKGREYGVGRGHLLLSHLRETPVVVAPIDEQREIVAEIERRFSVVDQLDVAVEQGLKRAERLRQSILKRAFEGKLVPQDPSDEPAAVLLERIRAARSTKHAKGREGHAGTRQGRGRRKNEARQDRLL